MGTVRLPVGALVVALMLGTIFAGGASAAPVARTTVDATCGGVSLKLMHPGWGGKAIWDISPGSVQNSPSYLLQRVQVNFYNSLTNVSEGGFDNSVGNKTGLDEVIVCSFRVEGDGFYGVGFLHLVRP